MSFRKKVSALSNARLLEEYGSIRESIGISVYKNGRAFKWMLEHDAIVASEIFKRMCFNSDQEVKHG